MIYVTWSMDVGRQELDLNTVFPNELCEKLTRNGINHCEVCDYYV